MEHVSQQAVQLNFILELSRTIQQDPRSCVGPFYTRFKVAYEASQTPVSGAAAPSPERQYWESYDDELKAFRERIRKRAKERIDEAVAKYEVLHLRKYLYVYAQRTVCCVKHSMTLSLCLISGRGKAEASRPGRLGSAGGDGVITGCMHVLMFSSLNLAFIFVSLITVTCCLYSSIVISWQPYSLICAQEMRECFEKRDIPMLQQLLMKMNVEEAKQHMKRCVDSGLWVPGPTDLLNPNRPKDCRDGDE